MLLCEGHNTSRTFNENTFYQTLFPRVIKSLGMRLIFLTNVAMESLSHYFRGHFAWGGEEDSLSDTSLLGDIVRKIFLSGKLAIIGGLVNSISFVTRFRLNSYRPLNIVNFWRVVLLISTDFKIIIWDATRASNFGTSRSSCFNDLFLEIKFDRAVRKSIGTRGARWGIWLLHVRHWKYAKFDLESSRDKRLKI